MSRPDRRSRLARLNVPERVRNRTARALQHRWRMRPYRSSEPHIVIGGSPRSGTTVLRQLIDEHPEACCGGETGIFLPGRLDVRRIAHLYDIPEEEIRSMKRDSASQGELIDRFADRYRRARGRARWAEKTPLNIWHLGWILERFPDSRIVHVVRDGRDVVCSMREFPEKRWVDDHWEDRPRHHPVAEYARRWVVHTGKGLARRGDRRYVEVRYEDLVGDPEPTWVRLQDALALERVPLSPAAEGTSRHVPSGGALRSSSVGRWQRDLSEEDLDAVLRVAGARLRELGYLE
jgi:hypothetical protein